MFSDPSEMIFSGPIVTRGPQPGQRVARAQSRGQEAREGVEVGPHADPQQLGTAGLAFGPGVDALVELEVDEPGDSLGGGLLHRLQVGVGRGALGAEHLDQARVDAEPLALADHPVTLGHPEAAHRDGVEPRVVAVTADQHHRT